MTTARVLPTLRSALRVPSPPTLVARRAVRGLQWSRASPALQLSSMRLAAAAANVAPVPVPDANENDTDIAALSESRELGWARTFAERFELQDEVLGEGSFGVVRPVVSKENGKKYAAKLISKDSPTEWERYSLMLKREVTHWQQLQNCHQVVHLEGVYEVRSLEEMSIGAEACVLKDDEYVYIVQELCTGGDVQDFIKENGKLTEQEASQIITPILKMLAACHEKNICFGDVKPANFMIKKPYPCQRHLADPSAPRGDLIVKGIDFGCSQKISEEEKLKKRTGTPLYMAPEIFFGWYSVEVDIWAVGMMLYQLIAGKLPFFGDNAEQLKKGPTFMIVQAVMESDLDFSGAEWEAVSADLKEFIRALLDVDYNTRLTAKAALHHPWIKQHSRENVIVEGPLGNIIKFPGSPGAPVLRAGGSGDSEDGKGGLGN